MIKTLRKCQDAGRARELEVIEQNGKILLLKHLLAKAVEEIERLWSVEGQLGDIAMPRQTAELLEELKRAE